MLRCFGESAASVWRSVYVAHAPTEACPALRPTAATLLPTKAPLRGRVAGVAHAAAVAEPAAAAWRANPLPQ
eukprot:176220-Chlamydomonas_euryale.AAC.3